MNLFLFILLCILTPVLGSILYYFIKKNKVKNFIVLFFSVVFIIISVLLGVLLKNDGGNVFISRSELNFNLNFIIKIAILAIVVYLASFFYSKKKLFPAIIVSIQLLALIILETTGTLKSSDMYFHIDYFSYLIFLISYITGAISAIASISYLRKYNQQLNLNSQQSSRIISHYFLLLCGTTGLLFSANLLIFYLFWQVSSIAITHLIYEETENSKSSRYKFFFNTNALGGCIVLLLLTVFSLSGKIVSISEISYILGKQMVYNNVVLKIAFLLFIVAILFRSYLIPFKSQMSHISHAPVPVGNMVLNTIMLNSGIAILLKFMHVVEGFGSEGIELIKRNNTFCFYGIALFFICAYRTIIQKRGKDIFAWYSIGVSGLVLALVFSGSVTGVISGIIIMIINAVTMTLLYICLSSIEYKTGTQDVEKMYFLTKEMPYTTAFLTVGIILVLFLPFGTAVLRMISLEIFTKNPYLIFLFIIGIVMTLICWVRWLMIILILPHEDTYKREIIPPYYFISMPIAGTLALFVNIWIGKIITNIINPYLSQYMSIENTQINQWFKYDMLTGSFGIIAISIIILLFGIVTFLFTKYTPSGNIKAVYTQGEDYEDYQNQVVLYHYKLLGKSYEKTIEKALDFALLLILLILIGMII